MVLTNPPFGKKSSITIVNRGRRRGEREGLTYHARRLLGHHQQQAAQLPPARPQHCSRSTAARPSSCPTTCCLRAAPARRCAASCSTNATSIPCCACPPASSTPRASRPTCSSSTASPPAKRPGPRSCGSTISAPTSTSRSRPTRSKRADLDDFVALLQPGEPHRADRDRAFPARFAYEDLLKRDKVNLDIFWLRDDSLGDSANLPDPDVIASRDRRRPGSRPRPVRADRSRSRAERTRLRPKLRAPRLPVTTFYIFYLLDSKAFPLARRLESSHPPATIGMWNAY